MSDYINKDALKNDITANLPQGRIKAVFLELVDSQPALDETEIIRKAFERVVERLEEKKRSDGTESDREWGKYIGYVDSIKIVKEECGISE